MQSSVRARQKRRAVEGSGSAAPQAKRASKGERIVRATLSDCGYQSESWRLDANSPSVLLVRALQLAIIVRRCAVSRHEGCTLSAKGELRSPSRGEIAAQNATVRPTLRKLRADGMRTLQVRECGLLGSTNAGSRLANTLEALRNEALSSRDATAAKARDYAIEYKFASDGKSITRNITKMGKSVGRSTIAISRKSARYADPHAAFDHAWLLGSSVISKTRQKRTLRVVDLFSGCGGLSLGAREAANALGIEFQASLAVDIDEAAIEVYKQNFRPDSCERTDIATILDGELGARTTNAERRLLKKVGNVDAVVAGPPCQGYSSLNNHSRNSDDRNRLYERVARFAEIARPAFVLIENVPSVTVATELSLHRSIRALVDAGYNVSSGVVDLAEIGVPQLRRRHVVLASIVDTPSVGAVLDRHRVARHRSVRWAIADIEALHSTADIDKPAALSSANRKRIQFLASRGVFELPNRLRPDCHRNHSHSYKSMYGRMHYGFPAQTITSGFSSPGQGRFVHPSMERTITAHEAARLQFLPDSFRLDSLKTRASRATTIGNAVPPKLAFVFLLDFLLRSAEVQR